MAHDTNNATVKLRGNVLEVRLANRLQQACCGTDSPKLHPAPCTRHGDTVPNRCHRAQHCCGIVTPLLVRLGGSSSTPRCQTVCLIQPKSAASLSSLVPRRDAHETALTFSRPLVEGLSVSEKPAVDVSSTLKLQLPVDDFSSRGSSGRDNIIGLWTVRNI